MGLIMEKPAFAYMFKMRPKPSKKRAGGDQGCLPQLHVLRNTVLYHLH